MQIIAISIVLCIKFCCFNKNDVICDEANKQLQLLEHSSTLLDQEGQLNQVVSLLDNVNSQLNQNLGNGHNINGINLSNLSNGNGFNH